MLCYIDGAFFSQEEAKISVLDLSILRGFGVFDYVRTYGGRPFHLEDHLLRLQSSADHLGLPLPKTLPEIEAIVTELLLKNPFPESNIKILLTGGVSHDHFTPVQSSLIAFNYPFIPFPEHHYIKGIDVITTSLARTFPTTKTLHYAPGISALQKNQAHDALYLNPRREILESTTCNFFAIKKGTLITCCSEEILSGITRKIVLQLTNGKIPLEKRSLHYDEIPDIDEAFLTSTSKEVLPIRTIDARPIGNGSPGPLTKHILALFRAYTRIQL